MSDGLLRVSEAEALDVADLALSKGKLLVTIRRSKTDQDGKGVVFRGGPGTERLARKWLDAAQIEEGSVFRVVNKAGLVAASRLRPAACVTSSSTARRMEIEGRVSGHSLRVSSAQSLRDRGTTTTDLMTAGRWNRVETMVGYVREQDAAFGPMARLRYGVEPPSGGRNRPHRRGKARPPSANGGGHERSRSACEERRKSSRKGLHASEGP